MKIRLLADMFGPMINKRRGDEADVADELALAWIATGHAEAIDAAAPAAKRERATGARARSTR